MLVAGRERLVGAAVDHVEIECDAARLELHGIDDANPRRDAGALEIVGIEQREALLVAARQQDLEAERLAVGAAHELSTAQDVARVGQEGERAAHERAVAPGTVGHRRRPGAVEHVGAHCVRIGSKQRALARVRRDAARGQLRAREEAAGALVEAKEDVLVDPLEVVE